LGHHRPDWIVKLDGFLSLNDRNVLDHAGKISHQMAKELAESEYDKFHNKRLQIEIEQATAQALEQLSRMVENTGRKNE